MCGTVLYGMTWFDSVALVGPGQGMTRHGTARHDKVGLGRVRQRRVGHGREGRGKKH